MKNLLAWGALTLSLLLLSSPALSQSFTRAQLSAQNNQYFYSNGQAKITGPIVNSMNGNIISSMGILGDTNSWTGVNSWGGASTFNGTATFNGSSVFNGPTTLTGSVNGVISLFSFGAKCDGITDDTAAITAWAAAMVSGVAGVISGQCTTTTGFTIAGGNRISILGNGDNSAFVYTGANTTVSPFIFGTFDAGAGCSLQEFMMDKIKFTSNTVMTAGTGVTFNDICDGRINNVTYGGEFGGNLNWWNAVHYAGGNSVYSRGGTIEGKNDCLTINGDDNFAFTDPFFFHVKIDKCVSSGLRIAGRVGGLFFDDSDILENGTNILVDQSQQAHPNLQLFFGPNFASDVTTGGAGIGFHVTEAGGPQFVIIYKGWLASATNQCFVFDSGVPTSGQPAVVFSGAQIGNCHAPGGSNGAIENQNLNNLVSITGTRFFTSQGGRPTVFNVAGASPVIFQGNVTNDANFNIIGPYSGTWLHTSGLLSFLDAQAAGNQSVTIDGSGNSNGAGLRLLGNGNTAPSKYLRSKGGNFELVNNAYSVTLLSVSDAGALEAASTVKGTGFIAGAGVGVSCSGSPTVSFASVNGIVTHC